MSNLSVDFFREDDGTKPVGAFIRSLNVKLKAKVVADLHLLEEYGNMAREPLSKHLALLKSSKKRRAMKSNLQRKDGRFIWQGKL